MNATHNLISTAARIYDWKVWLTLQLVHFAAAAANAPYRSAPVPNRLAWYVAENLLVIVLLGGLLVCARCRRRAVQRNRSDDRAARISDSGDQIERLLSARLILDSNIWMNPGLNGFFERLASRLSQRDSQLTLFGPQLDEICNIKDRSPFGSERARLSRMALNRVETMQRRGLLRINPVVLQAAPDAFADPLILKLIRRLTSDGRNIHFVSDDRELRIRAREIAERERGNISVRDSGSLH